MSIKLQLT